jgi:hypothetical protein
MICSGPKCDREVWAKGMCLAHYKQSRKGDLYPLVKAAKSVADKIRLGSEVDPVSGCWNWQMKLNNGYGRVTHEGRTIGIHVASVLVLRGESIPDGCEVCHRCNNRACCNPDHLYVGTRSDNVQDAVAAGTWRNNPKRGDAHPMAKLTGADVVAIRCSPDSVASIAERYGVTRQAVHLIRKRRTWKHVA